MAPEVCGALWLLLLLLRKLVIEGRTWNIRSLRLTLEASQKPSRSSSSTSPPEGGFERSSGILAFRLQTQMTLTA